MRTKADPRAVRSAVLAWCLLCAACGGSAVAPPAATPQPPATLQVGDATLNASAIQSSTLPEAAAAQHGVDRDDGTVLLVVGVRRGAQHAEVSVPARVTASAADLLGNRREIALREIRSGDFIDYAGAVEITPPETLRFEVTARIDGGAPAVLRFHRDFFPR